MTNPAGKLWNSFAWKLAHLGAGRDYIKWRDPITGKIKFRFFRDWTAPEAKELVLQFRLDRERPFNRISFDLSNSPMYYSVYYYDSNRQSMVLMKDFRNNALQGYINGITRLAGPGRKEKIEWVSQAFLLNFVKTNLVEIRIKPVKGSTVSIRNFYMGWHVVSPPPPPDEPPPPPPPPPQEDFPQYELLSFSANDAINVSNTFWQSPPLGPDSVYPFIVDLRNEAGEAQIFDKIKMTPLFTGSHFNVYYSNEEIFDNFHLSYENKTEITLKKLIEEELISANITEDDWIEEQGILLNENRIWSFKNSNIRLSTFHPFTIGFQVAPQGFTEGVQHLASIEGNNSNINLTFDSETIVDDLTSYDITSISSVGSTASLSTSSANVFDSLNVGDFIKISNISLSKYNGIWEVKELNEPENKIIIKFDKTNLPLVSGTEENPVGTFRLAKLMSGNLNLLIGDNTLNIFSVKLVEDCSYIMGFSWDKLTNKWYLYFAPTRSGTVSVTSNESLIEYSGEIPKQIVFGKFDVFDSFNGIVRNVWAKQDGYHLNTIRNFLRNTSNFIYGVGNRNIRTNGYFNTMLSAPLTTSYQYKFGPNKTYYEAKKWSPVNRDFVLNTDVYDMGLPVQAKFVKLEFSKPITKYYNPATIENVLLPVYSYPERVRRWFIDNNEFATATGNFPVNNFFFESGPTRRPSPNDRYGLINIKSALDGSRTSTIFNLDQLGIDFALNPSQYNEYLLTKQIQNNSIHMRFPVLGKHRYEVNYIPMRAKKAYFYGIQSLTFIRSDQTKIFDNKTYFGMSYDSNWIDELQEDGTIDGFRTTFKEDEYLIAEEVGATIVSKEFESFSPFQNVQFGALTSPLTDLIPSNKINLIDVSHLSKINLSDETDTSTIEIESSVKGTTDGLTVLMRRGKAGIYTVETSSVELSTATTVWANSNPGITLVAGCRISSKAINPKSIYELRLQAKQNDEWVTCAVQKFVPLANREWSEHEIAYLTQSTETEFKVQIVQTDFDSNEQLLIDMMGLWMSPMKFEIANYNEIEGDYVQDGWTTILHNVSNPFGIITVPKTRLLKLKITAVAEGAWFSGWSAVPHYLNTPINIDNEIFKQNDWAVSDSLVDRIVNRQMFFSNEATKMLPRRYSIYNDIIGARTVF